jgi:hypothetical protein
MSRLPPHQLDAKLRAARIFVWISIGVITSAYFRTQILGYGSTSCNRVQPAASDHAPGAAG